MKKQLIRGICIAIAMTLTFSAIQISASAEQTTDKILFSILSANVAGLPIPSAFSDVNRVVPTAQAEIGKRLNESGIDIICTQEDFQFHDILAKQMTNYPYKTYTSGGVPVGDGLNIFSKYPIYNIDREAWKDFCGILDHANDGLTPKGLIRFTADINGVLVDIYDIHIDANGSEEDQLAKKKQFIQLSEHIKSLADDRPVVITGDMNCTLRFDSARCDFYKTMMEENSFKDAWAEYVNGGNYLNSSDAGEIINQYSKKYNGQYWGLWDSVERVLYRDGNGAKLTPTDFEYWFLTDENGSNQSYSDHAMMQCTIEINTADYSRPELKLNEEKRQLLVVRIIHGARMVFRCLGLMIPDLFRVIREKANTQ